MTTAERTANERQNHAAIVIACGAVGIASMIWLLPNTPGWLAFKAIGSVLLFCGTTAVFLRTVLNSEAQCPNCSSRSARFIVRESTEYLKCNSCGLDEPTGYDYTS